jgi:hypothetical protein
VWFSASLTLEATLPRHRRTSRDWGPEKSVAARGETEIHLAWLSRWAPLVPGAPKSHSMHPMAQCLAQY